MNPNLSLLHPYPFQKLRELFVGVVPNPDLKPVRRFKLEDVWIKSFRVEYCLPEINTNGRSRRIVCTAMSRKPAVCNAEV